MIKASELKRKSITLKQIEDYLQALVLKASANGQFTIRTYGPEGIFGESSMYSGDYPPIVESTLKMLKEHGYRASIVAEEKQFVDIYLHVSWD